MDFSFLSKAIGIVFRESFEAVLIYGIIISYFRKHSDHVVGLKMAQLGLWLGILASVAVGLALSGASPAFSPEVFSYLEIAIVFAGSMLMLYMVFWMSEHSRHFKQDIESGIQQQKSVSIVGAVFVAVFREGIETVVYLYSLTIEKSDLSHRSGVLLSLVIGVSLAFLVYRLMIHGSKHMSMRTVFRISSLWLLFSASSLLATGVDKIYSAGLLEDFSEPLFTVSVPESFLNISNILESFLGLRFQPSLFHVLLFLGFWTLIIVRDPLKLRHQSPA